MSILECFYCVQQDSACGHMHEVCTWKELVIHLTVEFTGSVLIIDTIVIKFKTSCIGILWCSELDST